MLLYRSRHYKVLNYSVVGEQSNLMTNYVLLELALICVIKLCNLQFKFEANTTKKINFTS